jgi:hypothetical protein
MRTLYEENIAYTLRNWKARTAGPGDTAGGTQYRNRVRDSATAGTPRRRLSAVVAANPRGAIYGTIVATAVIAATAAGGKSPALILAATVATLH